MSKIGNYSIEIIGEKNDVIRIHAMDAIILDVDRRGFMHKLVKSFIHKFQVMDELRDENGKYLPDQPELKWRKEFIKQFKHGFGFVEDWIAAFKEDDK